MNVSRKFSLLALLFSLALPGKLFAATLYMLPTGGILSVGQSVDVDVRVDSTDEPFNAAQATLLFPKNTLEVVSVDYSSDSSVFGFWVTEPKYSNTDGTVSFSGGTTNSISGGSVPIVKVKFRAKAVGEADVTAADAAITAADGKGTNILSVINIARFTIRPGQIEPTKPATKDTPAVIPTVAVVAPPVQITRTPTAAEKKPLKPEVVVPLYPREDEWSGRSADFIAQWKLPSDITGVSTALNRDAKFVPSETSEGLFESKAWPALTDGEWYLHVRFKNSLGWGEVLHRRIQIDTRPPLPVEISMNEGIKTDVPNPKISFISADALSGIASYEIRVDGGEREVVAATSTNMYQFPLLPPGKHSVAVRAIDNAGNGIGHSLDFEILPITAPSITHIPTEVYSDTGKGIGIKGSALPRVGVVASLVFEGGIVSKSKVEADANGAWSHTFTDPLHNGSYKVIVYAEDSRGALSLPVESDEILAKNEPIFQVGSFELDMLGALLLVVTILVVGFAAGAFYYRREKQKLSMRVGFTQSESEKMFRLLKEDVVNLKHSVKSTAASYGLKKLEEDVEKMDSYMKKGIDKIKK